MKKMILTLSVLMLLTYCKDKDQNEAGPIENSRETVGNEDGDTAVKRRGDSLNLVSTGIPEANSALVKNEDESYSFRYNLKKGQTYPLNLRISQNQSMTANGQTVNISSGRTVNFNYY